ncbi:MAG: hypothetical protein KJ930_10425 [Gammaproteobacteria bacterium]|nr:hypothetical protein [Gammaproteobacteria bacterium]MBU2179831.1 hypothetical protein [Gammaproteobacteria bacterium]MBU2224075.1 hypothetical protein [Gammaproteobacteria bacterium]MBU2278505.1 hypothetical protein [Gammaproteobacteria bacterium]MBU2427995.1 hypothetical protein [Gammaproteobacteria bacterium]
MNVSKIYLLMLGLSWLVSGCTTIPNQQEGLVNQLDGSLAQLQVDTKQLYQRMQRLTADKSCKETNECKVLAVGKRPCGGPEQFLVYSATSTDEKLLAITNDRYTKLKAQQQQRLGMQSTCQMLPTPLPQCQSRECTIVE